MPVNSAACSASSTRPATPVTKWRRRPSRTSIDNFQTHVVPIIADIDAGFGNAEATYLLAKKMIEAGACAIQIENQVSDEKQCGHQDGKVTVPHEDFLAKIRAVRYAFLELGVEDGIIVARTDSLGAGLTKQIAVTHRNRRYRRQVQQLPRRRLHREC
jgi:isocitrate lyase